MSRLTELQIAYLANDNRIGIRDLRADSVQSGSPINTASVTVTMVLSGTASTVGGVSWPIALTLVTSGTGTGEDARGSRWEGVLPDALSLTAGEHYQAEVTANAGDGFLGFWKIRVLAKHRES